MPTMQEFLAEATRQAVTDLEEALLRLPEDKRNWSPMESARTALDQAAECAILAGSTADLIQSRTWNTAFSFEDFARAKTELAQDGNALHKLLQENTEKVIAVILAVSDEDLGVEVQTPFGTMTLKQIITYPYWNLSYHQGQINYIASMLGCLP